MSAIRRIFPLVLILMFLLPVLAAATEDEEAAGQAAEQAGKRRLALTHYIAALQSASEGSDADQRLREKIITLAPNLRPPPALPLEAKKHMARGQGALELAQKPEDFQAVLSEFRQASLAAPWWADAYYNLAQVQEKVGNYQQAIQNLHWYLKAAPHATDSEAVELQIAKLEAKQQTAAKAQAEAARARQAEQEQAKAAERRQSVINGLSGNWSCQDKCDQASVRVSGQSFSASVLRTITSPQEMQITLTFSGTVNGLEISGTLSLPPMHDNRTNCDTPTVTRTFSGTIGPDGKSLALRFSLPVWESEAQRTSYGISCISVNQVGEKQSDVTLIR